MSTNGTRRVTRRRFLKGAALTVGAAAAGVTAPQVSRAAATVLRMQSMWPATQIFYEMGQQYIERVERMAGRRLRIDLRPMDAVVPAIDLHNACHEGRLDAGLVAVAPLEWRHRAAGLFDSGPAFGGDSAGMLAWMHRGGGQELYDELLQELLGLKLVAFHILAMPNQPFGWFRDEIREPHELIGLRYRTPSLSAMLARKLGMMVVRTWPHEVKAAMERGMLDGFEFNNPTSDRRFGGQDVAGNYVMASFHQSAEFLEVIFNKERYEALPDELQAILRYGAEAACTANHAIALDEYSSDLRRLIEEDEVNVYRTPDGILDRQLEAWDEVLEEGMSDPFFSRVVESQRSWSKRVAFYQLINRPDYARAYRHFFGDVSEF